MIGWMHLKPPLPARAKSSRHTQFEREYIHRVKTIFQSIRHYNVVCKFDSVYQSALIIDSEEYGNVYSCSVQLGRFIVLCHP